MRKISKQLAALIIVAFVISFQFIRSTVSNFSKQQTFVSPPDSTVIANFHSQKELIAFNNFTRDPIEPGETFLHSDNCAGCHGPDPLQYGLVTYDSVDVNIYDDWRATMMANSARDPMWRAKVSHEILVNPGHANELQDKCTSCHAPMGRYSSYYKGYPFYTIADMLNSNDSLGLDGVSCVACHMIGDQGLGTMFSGEIPYDTNHVLYGPFTGVQTGPMQLYVGMTPTWSEHVSEGRMCSSCHTLLTNSVDLSGNFTGRQFVEQATYHEWLNSSYAVDQVNCQSCHMPKTADSVRIATGYFGLEYRFPFNEHQFQGSNLFMLNLMKNNKTSLGVKATDANYDSSITATENMLRYKTMDVNLAVDSVNADTAYFTVRLTNKAGHKFPSGYPSRRAVLQFVVVGSSNDTIFQSGFFDPNYEVININPQFEPHYDVITSENEVQIYEMVPGDVNGNYTSVLERADTILKDNRIPPEGFKTTALVYDTVRIMGGAALDPDFNINPITSLEGSGRDYVHYHVPLGGYSQPFSIYTYVYYQPIPPGFLAEMFTYSSTEIDTFQSMYGNADKSPFLVAGDSVLNITLGTQVPDYEDLIKVGPSPTNDGWINVFLPQPSDYLSFKLYDVRGKYINTWSYKDQGVLYNLQIPEVKGAYILVIEYKGKLFVRKILRD